MVAKSDTTGFKFPIVGFDAIVSIQKANLDTFVEAQSIMVDAAQAMAKLQYAWLEDSMKSGQEFLKGDVARKKPEDFVADAKAAAEKTLSVVREQADLGMKAQKQVTDLLTKRVTANIEEAKTFAA